MAMASKIVRQLLHPGESMFCDSFYSTDPPDDELQSSLLQYAKERLTVDQRLQRLKVDHGLDIK